MDVELGLESPWPRSACTPPGLRGEGFAGGFGVIEIEDEESGVVGGERWVRLSSGTRGSTICESCSQVPWELGGDLTTQFSRSRVATTDL
jgi:hypothetical protein